MKNAKTNVLTQHRWVLVSAALSFAFLVAGIVSATFADAYAKNVFPVWVGIYGRLTSLVPFSVGEWMLILAAVLVFILMLLTIAVLLVKKWRGLKSVRAFYTLILRLSGVFIPVMMLNCFILYRCTPVTEAVSADGARLFEERTEYTVEELAKLRDMAVLRCNELAEKVARNERGEPVFDAESSGTGLSSLSDTAREAVRSLGDTFPRLNGFQVRPKPLFFSGFISQQNMQGYYFPFSMEANYNDVMLKINAPFAICHELAHTHGYILEDEANFIGFLACVRSDDLFFKYSGWVSAMNYLDNDLYRQIGESAYRKRVRISDQVLEDDRFLSDEAWEKVEESAVLSTETVRKAADTYVDVTLKTNGVEEGRASYSKMVALLLRFEGGFEE